MENDLQNTLDKLIESGSDDNPALNKLISDYTTYHLVLVVLGGLFCLALALLGVYLDKKGFRRTPKTDRGTSTFERRTYFYGGISSITVSLALSARRVDRSSQAVLAKAFRGELTVMSETRK